MDSGARAEKKQRCNLHLSSYPHSWPELIRTQHHRISALRSSIHATVKVNWPTESAGACATFLRDLLQ